MTKPLDFLTHMKGTWHVERTVSDGKQFQGLAQIRPTDVRGVYGYHEEGSFIYDETAHEAYRDYLYKVKGDTLTILFADPHRKNQPYVSLTFSGSLIANDTYLCGDDIYGHIFEIISGNEFHTETVVSGPHKDYRLNSIYRRL